MPGTIGCSQRVCIHNRSGACGASIINVVGSGKGKNNTFCSTYTDDPGAAQSDSFDFELSSPLDADGDSPRVGCSVQQCRYNDKQACSKAGELDIRSIEGRLEPICGSYKK